MVNVPEADHGREGGYVGRQDALSLRSSRTKKFILEIIITPVVIAVLFFFNSSSYVLFPTVRLLALFSLF